MDTRFHHIRGSHLERNGDTIVYQKQDGASVITFTIGTYANTAEAKAKLRSWSTKNFTLASIKLGESIYVAYSQCHAGDKFVKAKGRAIAAQRLEHYIESVNTPNDGEQSKHGNDPFRYGMEFKYMPNMYLKAEFLNEYSLKQRYRPTKQSPQIIHNKNY